MRNPAFFTPGFLLPIMARRLPAGRREPRRPISPVILRRHGGQACSASGEKRGAEARVLRPTKWSLDGFALFQQCNLFLQM